jgi:galactokinase
MADEAEVVSEFRRRFVRAPTVVVRAPGRVNIIGEHTDYSLLPVMPMAIQRSLVVASGPGDGRHVSAHSLDFGDAVVAVDGPSGDAPTGWARYLAAAVDELPTGAGAHLVVGGDLAPESGLSSSAALITGVLAALAGSAGHELDRDALVRMAIAAEQRVGVRSGGMDQTVVVHAHAGSLLRIDFDPQARRDVPLPEGLAIVLAYSGERAAKAGPVRQQFNGLVLAAQLAAIMLSRELGTPEHRHLSKVVDNAGVGDAARELPDSTSFADVFGGGAAAEPGGADAAADVLPPGFPTDLAVPVGRAARHALAEAERVDRAEAALIAGDVATFGRLLDASQASLRDQLRCSTAALDRVCAAMRDAGALGARLTGAGFGGLCGRGR